MTENMSVQQLEDEIKAVAIDGKEMSAELHRRIAKFIQVYNPNLPLILKTYSYVKETGLPYDGLDIVSGSREYSIDGYEKSVFTLARQLAHVDDEYSPYQTILRMMGRVEPVIKGGAKVYLEFSDTPIEITEVRCIHPNHEGFYYSRPHTTASAYAPFLAITHVVPNEDSK